MFSIIDRNGKKEMFRFFQAVNKPTAIAILEDEIEALSSYSFHNKDVGKLDLIYLPDTITEIPPHAFQGCPARSIRMSRNVKTIYENAFSDMPNLWMLRVPEGCNLGIKRYDGVWVNGESVFANSPKHAAKWKPWIDMVVEDGVATILWEGEPNDVLLTSTDVKTWEVVKTDRPELYQYKVDGTKRFFKVGTPNTNPTARTKGQAYLSKSGIVQIK